MHKTNQQVQKVQPKRSSRAAIGVAWAAGALEALLLARLLARLLAARPDNPAFMLLYGITSPLVTPLRALDYDQPPFGAALEFSTLAVALILPLLAYGLWAALGGRNSGPGRDV